MGIEIIGTIVETVVNFGLEFWYISIPVTISIIWAWCKVIRTHGDD